MNDMRSTIRRVLNYLGIALFACIGSSCMATARLSEKMRETRSSSHEFATTDAVKGNYLGTQQIGAIEYHHYTFPKALVDHSKRELVLLIPTDRFRQSMPNNPHAIMRETPPSASSGRQAILYLSPTRFNSSHPGQDQALRWPTGTSPNLNRDLGVVVIWVPYGKDDRNMIIAQSAPGVSKSNKSFNSYYLDSKLKYVARNEAEVGKKSLGYLGTVPLDIITSPFQALVIAAFATGP